MNIYDKETQKGCKRLLVLTILLWTVIIIIVFSLFGCTTMSSEQIGDIAIKALANRVATQPGYNWQQGIRDGQNDYTQHLINYRLQQEILNNQ